MSDLKILIGCLEQAEKQLAKAAVEMKELVKDRRYLAERVTQLEAKVEGRMPKATLWEAQALADHWQETAENIEAELKDTKAELEIAVIQKNTAMQELRGLVEAFADARAELEATRLKPEGMVEVEAGDKQTDMDAGTIEELKGQLAEAGDEVLQLQYRLQRMVPRAEYDAVSDERLERGQENTKLREELAVAQAEVVQLETDIVPALELEVQDARAEKETVWDELTEVLGSKDYDSVVDAAEAVRGLRDGLEGELVDARTDIKELRRKAVWK